ncbi:MAG: hypothetical protein A3K09_01065 [Nitrospinae bacterium RIFCSPLOWO2_12_FULL_47_7]|nr:MAG: hypothetical protein A3K09_01065 [Nitrospinae bacterium RIFCSPLOWO2_12_FULL_47_7]
MRNLTIRICKLPAQKACFYRKGAKHAKLTTKARREHEGSNLLCAFVALWLIGFLCGLCAFAVKRLKTIRFMRQGENRGKKKPGNVSIPRLVLQWSERQPVP